MDFQDLILKLEKTKNWFKNEVSALRTGRANPALVENIRIDSYGTPTLLSHLASIRLLDAKTLVIEPWDKTAIQNIAKAISVSALGIQPIADKNTIRISLPELSQERRQALEKILRQKLEEAKIAVRKDRDEVWHKIQEKERAKEISEDEKFKLKERMQKEIDKTNQELESIAEVKRKEIYG